MYVAERNTAEVVSTIVIGGAYVKATDKAGWQAADYARHNPKFYGSNALKILLPEDKNLWIEKAEQGNTEARIDLGNMCNMLYQEGKGIEQDYLETLKWFRLAAEHANANANAEFYLDRMYMTVVKG